MKMKAFVAVGLVIIGSNSLVADTIIFNDGHVLDGIVLQTNQSGILVQRDYGTYTYPSNLVKQIKRESALTSAQPSTNRIFNWQTIVGRFARQSWAYNAKQIPATVIDTGVFKNVPYSSFRAGGNFELNIYGDPNHPAAVEVGVYGGLLNDDFAKKDCIEFIASVLSETADRDLVRKMNLKKDLSNTNGLVFEVTPSTAEDAYGGWWISAYDETQVNASRASDREMKQISEPIAGVADESFNPLDSKWSNQEKQQALPRYVMPQTPPSTSTDITANSSSADDSYIGRNSHRTYRSASHSSNSGSVYVRSYTRSDGTYVHAHTRSR